MIRRRLLPSLCGLALAVSLPFSPVQVQAQGNFFQDSLETLMGGASQSPGGSQGGSSQSGLGALTASEVAAGLREALKVGSSRVVDQLGVTNGFNLDPTVHIPLPGALQQVQQALKPLGMSRLADDLELRLNRAAETAVGKAEPLFMNAIENMTLQDVTDIFNGPADAATRYFQRQMTPGLKGEMRPVINSSLAEVGAVQAYDQMMGQYRSLPFMPDVKAELVDHTMDGALDGLFHYLAEEEAAIRANPAQRTTDLLRKVFGSQ